MTDEQELIVFTRCQGCHQERSCVEENGVALCVKGEKGCNKRRGSILATIEKMEEEKREKRRA